MKNYLILILFCLMSIGSVLSQEKKPQAVVDNYLKELELDRKQKKQFTLILKKYALQLSDKELSVGDYNALMKKETLEIYEILNPKQFSEYKKLRKIVEPNKKYRIENN